MNPEGMYRFILLCLCIWREARGESLATKVCVAWSIRNRVMLPRWWGTTFDTVILKPFQYSSFNANDPNAHKLPAINDPSWLDSIAAAKEVFNQLDPVPTINDPTSGATSYFDDSISPPSWATDGSNELIITSGRLNFYKISS